MRNKEVIDAEKVLELESLCIDLAKKQLNQKFVDALDILHAPKNKIIICGIGKSGHLGKKMAATFSSTGSPACFLHASEAVHGDLGIHQKKDPVIFLSNSSSTPELMSLFPIFRKQKSKIIGIMGNLNGPLVKKVDVFLNASVPKEADPLGIVPTASFTVASALGDALASGLMKRNNFTRVNYAKTHPAGQLGRNLLFKVFDVMHPLEKIAITEPKTTIKELVIEMTTYPLGAALVIKNNNFLGIVTDGDLRRALSKENQITNMTAQEVMNKTPTTIDSDLSLENALKIMEQKNKQISVLPVISKKTKKIVGLVRLHDIYSPSFH